MTQNPWKPVGSNDQSEVAIKTLQRARASVARHGTALPDLRTALTAFDEDLAAILRACEKDASAYRLARSFIVVQLPAILSILDVLRDPDGDPDQSADLSARLVPCLAAATQARSAVADGICAEADIAMSVLERQVIAHGFDPEPEPGATASDTGIMSGVSRFAKLGLSKITGTTAAVQSTTIAVGTDVANRSIAGATLLKTYATGACEDGVHALVTPVTTRFRAARAALLNASVSAVFDIGLVAIFFPPAVPFAVGLALLDAPLRYEDALDKARTAAEIAREKRLAERRDAADFARAGLRGLAEIVRIETPCVTLVIDAESGDADGTILCGRHIGKALSALDHETIDALREHAPDQETRDILESWQRRTAA